MDLDKETSIKLNACDTASQSFIRTKEVNQTTNVNQMAIKNKITRLHKMCTEVYTWPKKKGKMMTKKMDS